MTNPGSYYICSYVFSSVNNFLHVHSILKLHFTNSPSSGSCPAWHSIVPYKNAYIIGMWFFLLNGWARLILCGEFTAKILITAAHVNCEPCASGRHFGALLGDPNLRGDCESHIFLFLHVDVWFSVLYHWATLLAPLCLLINGQYLLLFLFLLKQAVPT